MRNESAAHKSILTSDIEAKPKFSGNSIILLYMKDTYWSLQSVSKVPFFT